MATLPQILAAKWPGQSWTVTGDDYSTLVWDPANSQEKPDESSILSLSDEVDLLKAISSKVAEIIEKREALLSAGFPDSVTGKTFQTDPISQGKIAAVGALAGFAVIAGQSQTFQFIALDNSVVTMDALTTFDWSKRIASWVSSIMLYANQLKESSRAALTVADVQAIDSTTGWPST